MQELETPYNIMLYELINLEQKTMKLHKEREANHIAMLHQCYPWAHSLITASPGEEATWYLMCYHALTKNTVKGTLFKSRHKPAFTGG